MSVVIVKDFNKWTPNIEVSLWGRGKASANKSDCPLASPPGAEYPGDCDMCEMFMGAHINKSPVYWGDYFKACCWAKIERDA